ncbi:hypothetical protein RND71_012298 [Anisodus tanguticus]|uniref:Uncharacterized protein n=1 Tax=Anisodus tanguticus TaxID=243964 RepID=A0AAE1SEZ9_9SOLA|nr:hypothetical protein RND71_012298 [Anisodus tanguticus]
MARTPFIDKNGIKRGAWSEDEDNKLRAYVENFGHPNWRQLPKYAGLMRCGKSCRLRWMNYLRPGLQKGNYSLEEEELIIKLHKELGNRWSTIAANLTGRSDNDVKNHWHAHLKKRARLTNINSSTSTKQLTESSQSQSEQSCKLSEHNDQAGYDMKELPISASAHLVDTSCLLEVSSSDLSKLYNGIDWIEEDHIFRSLEQLSSINSLEEQLPDSFCWTSPIDNFQTEPLDNIWTQPFDNFWTQPFF